MPSFNNFFLGMGVSRELSLAEIFQLGYYWSTLHVGAQTITMDADGTVYELDDLHRLWMYRALDRYFVLPALKEGTPLRN